MTKLPLILAFLTLVHPLAPAAEWMTDMPAAQAKAQAEHKPILAEFTGSDWCKACVILRRHLLDTPAFETWAKERFILVEIDIPNSQDFDPDLKARNRELCDQYRIRSFPSILVLDHLGTVAGGFTGSLCDLAQVQQILTQAADNAAKLDNARALPPGEPRAHALMEVYNSLSPRIQDNAATLRNEIADNDPEDTCNLQARVRAERQMDAFNKEYRQPGEPDDKLLILDRYLAEAAPANLDTFRKEKAIILNLKGQKMLAAANTIEDILKARDCLLESASYLPAPSSAAAAQTVREATKDPQALLHQIQTARAHQQASDALPDK